MTMRTTDTLRCECGYSGTLRTKENDQPYSTPYVSHKLEGFGGTVTNWDLAEVVCPSCQQKGKVGYA